MIYDMISNISSYRGQAKWLDEAISFIETHDLSRLPPGRTDICSDKVFANVMYAQASPENTLSFEIHKKYMDIQIDLEGTELIHIGAGPVSSPHYDEASDFGRVDSKSIAACEIGPGRFIICMAEEPHKPGIAAGADTILKKCVIKVAVG